jgi:hypothetical protein
MATEKLKINYRLKNKTWTNPQIKNHKKGHELKTDQTTNTTQKSRTQVLKILNTTNTICGGKKKMLILMGSSTFINQEIS